MGSAILEDEPGTRNQVLDGLGDEYFRWAGGASDSCAGVNRDSADLLVDPFDLSGVDAGADLQAKRAHGVDDSACVTDGSRGAVEGGEEAVPGGVDLLAPITTKQGADGLMVALDERFPGMVAVFGGQLGRAGDISEDDGCKDALEVGLFVCDRAEESLDGANEGLGLVHPGNSSDARDPDHLGAGNPLGQIRGLLFVSLTALPIED